MNESRQLRCNLQPVETILRAEMFKLRKVVFLQTTGDGSAVRLGVKHVLRTVPGVNKWARLLQGYRDADDERQRANCHCRGEADGSPLLKFFYSTQNRCTWSSETS